MRLRGRPALPFDVQCKGLGLPVPEPEYYFAKPRRWRFDWAWPSHKLALEVDGGIWTGGRHTRGAGFLKDMEKLNAAARLGYRVVRFTPKQVRDGQAALFVHGMLVDVLLKGETW